MIKIQLVLLFLNKIEKKKLSPQTFERPCGLTLVYVGLKARSKQRNC